MPTSSEDPPATQRGHTEALAELYDATVATVYGYFLRRCGGRANVGRDLTQETFLSAARQLRSGADVRSPSGWIMTIARRRLVDHHRRRDVRRRVDPPVDPACIPGWGATDAEAKLVEALRGVSPDQRLALLLAYVDDLPVDDVAMLLDRSRSATESLLARARRSQAARYEELPDA